MMLDVNSDCDEAIDKLWPSGCLHPGVQCKVSPTIHCTTDCGISCFVARTIEVCKKFGRDWNVQTLGLQDAFNAVVNVHSDLLLQQPESDLHSFVERNCPCGQFCSEVTVADENPKMGRIGCHTDPWQLAPDHTSDREMGNASPIFLSIVQAKVEKKIEIIGGINFLGQQPPLTRLRSGTQSGG